MKNPFAKATAPVADFPKKQRGFKPRTILTHDFYQLIPVLSKDMYLKESLNPRGNHVLRTMPLSQPTFTGGRIAYRAFYVPYSTIFKGDLDFFERSKHIPASGSAGFIDHCPHCTIHDFVYGFLANSSNYTSGTSTNHDFWVSSNGTATYYKFTPIGALRYKILVSLGYGVDCLDLCEGKNPLEMKVNLLPLFSYLKVILDYYWPQQYAYNSQFELLDAMLRRDANCDTSFDLADVRNVLNVVGLSFYDDSQLFNNAWDLPNSPNVGSSPSTFIDVDSMTGNTGSSEIVQQDSSGTSPTPEIFNSVGRFTQIGLNFLSSLSDYLRRNQIAGASSIQRFLVRHGYTVDWRTANRSVYLGSKVFDLGITDVESTTQNSSANLGELAGKGFCRGSFEFSIKNVDTRGFFLILQSTIPDSDLYQGVDRFNYITESLQFYTPEFAKDGCQAVSSAELVLPQLPSEYAGSVTDTELYHNQVFAYLPQYYYHNLMKSRIIGDFNVNSRGGANLEKYHTFRKFLTSNFTNLASVHHNFDFLVPNDRAQYDRMFYVSSQLQDQFITYLSWSVDLDSSVPPLQDSFKFDQQGNHSPSGKSTTVETGGPSIS